MKLVFLRNIKDAVFIFVFIVCAITCIPPPSAQNNHIEKSGNDRFSIKTQFFMGTYLDPSVNIKDIDPNAPVGLNLGIEFPSSR